MNIRKMKMCTETGEKVIYIVDNAIPEQEIIHCYDTVKMMAFQRTEVDSENDKYPMFSTDLEPAEFLEHTLVGKTICELMPHFIPGKFNLDRLYVNMCHYGDIQYPHRDCTLLC